MHCALFESYFPVPCFKESIYEKKVYTSFFALRHILEHIRDKHYDEIDYIIMTGIFLSRFFGISGNIPEMEFLDISLTKDWSLMLHAIFHSPFYRRIWKKT